MNLKMVLRTWHLLGFALPDGWKGEMGLGEGDQGSDC